MEITVTLIAVIGTLVSIVASLLTNLIASKTFISKSKIKIGGVEFQLSGSADESTRRILDKVQELQESPQVFISYSFKDKEFAQHLATDLRKQGVKVWIADEKVKVGDKIVDTIRDGILSSQWVIAILSENSPKSDFIGKELSLALEEEKKKDRPFILPVLIGATELPAQLQDKQYADFREDYRQGFEKILARVKPSAIKTDDNNRSSLEIRREKIFDFYRQLINNGQWQLLALQLANQPDDISTISNMVLHQQQSVTDAQLRLLKSLLEENAIDSYQVSETGKSALKKLLEDIAIQTKTNLDENA